MESVTARQLRRRVDDLIRDWQVDVDYTSETESSLMVFGARGKQPVVMKVLRIHGDEWHSGEILDAFEGRGVEDGFTVDVRSPSLELAQVIRPILGARA